jgi:plastocyanin
MRAVVAVLAAALAVACALPAALADDGRVREVSIPGKVFAPGLLQILPGDTVTWRNGDATNHTATADDDAFDSGYLSPGTTFSLVFPKLGHYAYHCTIHKFMHGEIVVVPVALQGPGRPIVSGGQVVLHGLAPTGTGAVVVAQLGGKGHDRRVVPAGDGSFTVKLRALTPEYVAARVKKLASTPVRINVAPRVRVHLSGNSVTVTARPARPGARVALQRYVRELFAWRTVSRARLDASSRVTLSLGPGHAGRFRVVVRGGKGGWADGASGSLVRH